MIDRNKSNTTLILILIVAILGFLGLAQLKIISADIAVMTSGLCILSLVMLIIKDIVISNRNKKHQEDSVSDKK